MRPREKSRKEKVWGKGISFVIVLWKREALIGPLWECSWKVLGGKRIPVYSESLEPIKRSSRAFMDLRITRGGVRGAHRQVCAEAWACALYNPPQRLPTPLPFYCGGMSHQKAPEHSKVAFVYLVVQYLNWFTYGRVLVTFLLLRWDIRTKGCYRRKSSLGLMVPGG